MAKEPAAPTEARLMQLALAMIRTDGDTQSRPYDNDALREYIEQALAAQPASGTEIAHPFPPVEVYYDGKSYWLSDGFHRREAYKSANLPAINANVFDGSRDDAQWAAAAANQGHGVRRTQAAKEWQVKKALKSPLGSGKSNHDIATHCGVDVKTVAKYRSEMELTMGIPIVETRTGVDGRTINTANIGRKPAGKVDPQAAQEQIKALQRQAKESANGSTPHANNAAPEPDPVAPDLTDDEWLDGLPIYRHLKQFQHKALLLRHDALAYRTMEQSKALSNFHHHAARAITFREGGSTPFSRQIIAVAHMPHPREWMLCVSCKGKACHDCGMTGYTLHSGAKVPEGVTA